MADSQTLQLQGGENFSSTRWTTVFLAAQDNLPAARQAMERLCAAYWYPLYAYVRRQGHPVEDAQDLTQSFFARFLKNNHVQLADPKRGRFRTFLLTSLQHFLVSEWNKANCQKRSGGQKTLSLDEEGAEERFAAEPATAQAPEMSFDTCWAKSLLEAAMTRLHQQLATSGKAESFELLKGYVWGGEEAANYATAAARLGMSEGAFKVAVHRLRKDFGHLLRDEVGRTVATPEDIEEELRHLITVMRKGQ